jgi:DtxR family transcriptional regulator, manganese transport regulator
LATAVQTRRDISRVEDYLEAIYNLNEEKGFISASDISERLGVKSPTVSSMVSKLAKEGYLERERYRGMKLTDRGIKVARSVIRRHETIFELLSMLGLSKEVAYVDTEGIEHHLHPVTVQRFERLVEFLKADPETSAKLKQSMDRD